MIEVMDKKENKELIGFLEGKFGAIDKRFDTVDKRFNVVDKRFSTIDKRFDTVDKRLDTMDKRFDTVDKRLDTMDKRFDTVDKRFSTMDKRFDIVDREYKELAGFMGERFDAVDARLSRLEETKADKREVETMMERIAESKKNEILGALDSYTKHFDDQLQEHRLLVRQVNRHDDWIHKIAGETGTDLEY